MQLLDVFAAIGLFAGDLFEAVGLFGAAFLLLWMLAGRRMKRVPETMWVWAWAGTLQEVEELLAAHLLIDGEASPVEWFGTA
jgi:hypothetical protein